MQEKEGEPKKDTGLRKLVVVELEPRHVKWIKESVARGNGSFQDVLSSRIEHGFLILAKKDKKEIFDLAEIRRKRTMRLMKRWCVLNSETYSWLKKMASGSTKENTVPEKMIRAVLTLAVDNSYLVQRHGQPAVKVESGNQTSIEVGETLRFQERTDDRCTPVKVETVVQQPQLSFETTERLTVLAQGGSNEAFGEIFNRNESVIYNLVYRIMGNPDDAFDLTQETFLKAWKAISITERELFIEAWLYRIAKNICVGELRHRKLIREQGLDVLDRNTPFLLQFISGYDSPEQIVVKKEIFEDVQQVLNKILPRHRLVLILREYQELSYNEIAQALDMTSEGARSLVFRARRAFRRIWACKRFYDSIEQSTGGQIIKRRKELGLSQRELAKIANCSRGLVFEVEHGKGSKEAVIKLTEVLFRLVDRKFAKGQKSDIIEK